MTFTKRRIDVTFSLGKGRYGDQQGPDVTLRGRRVSAEIPMHASGDRPQLLLTVYGLDQETMNRLTTIGPVMEERRGLNLVRVHAGSDVEAPCVAYEGEIVNAWADYGMAPDSVLTVMAQVAGAKEVKPAHPRSYPGATPAQEVMREIATAMGYTFEGRGVNTVLANPYFSGTDMDQLRSCAQAARISHTIDRGVLAIWPADGFRQGDPIAVSPETGLIGYPAFTGSGLALKTLYNPDLALGKRVRVSSAIHAAQGEWTIVSLAHQLEADVPRGVWQSVAVCKRNLDG